MSAPNTMEENLSWLEQETKINTSLSMAQETKAKLNVLTLAVSTIADLTSTIKELKQEVETLKTEMNDFKMEINKNKKKCLTDEEKEILRIQSTEIIKTFIQHKTIPFPKHLLDEVPVQMMGRMHRYDPMAAKKHPKYNEYQNEYINIGVNYIVKKSKTIDQGIRISNKLSQCLKRFEFKKGEQNLLSINKLCKFTCFKEYKIVYMALYQMYNYINNNVYCNVDCRVIKSLSDGGLDLSGLEDEALGTESSLYFNRYLE